MTVGQAQGGGDAIAGFLEAQQLGVALDADAEGFETLDEQPFVFILREDFEKRVGCQTLADTAQGQVGHGLALDPEIGRSHAMAALDDGIRQAELAIQLQRPRLHGQCPRRGAGGRRLVDDPHADPQFAQPQGQHQPGRAGADDQDVASVHEPVLFAVWFKYGPQA
ncbi:hypothetical protein D3C86_1263230 [compost metagenome]